MRSVFKVEESFSGDFAVLCLLAGLGVIYTLLKKGVLTQMHKEVEEYETEIASLSEGLPF